MSLENISENGIFSIVAIDHRNSLRKLINGKDPSSVSAEQLEEIKYEFGKAFALEASAILIDPEYGKKCIEFCKKNNESFILSLEKSGYKEEDGRVNELMENYSSYVKEFKPAAIKLLIYYNPTDKSSEKQRELVKRIRKEFDLPFICEIRTYENEKLKDKKKLVIKSVSQISKFANIMKVEIPGEILPENFEELNKNCKIPWILLSAGVNFVIFKKALELASKSGCSGFAVGRALWQDSIKDGKLDKIFLNEVCIHRLKELKDITKNCTPYFLR